MEMPPPDGDGATVVVAPAPAEPPVVVAGSLRLRRALDEEMRREDRLAAIYVALRCCLADAQRDALRADYFAARTFPARLAAILRWLRVGPDALQLEGELIERRVIERELLTFEAEGQER